MNLISPFIGAILGAIAGGLFTYKTAIKRYFLERQVQNYSEFIYLIDLLSRKGIEHFGETDEKKIPKKVKEDFLTFEEKYRHRAELVKLATGENKIKEKINECLDKDNMNDSQKQSKLKKELIELMRKELHGRGCNFKICKRL